MSMLFINNKTNSIQGQLLNKPRQYMMPLSRVYVSPTPQIQLPLNIEVSYPEPKLKKMKWGEPTWFLFHTLAHKINDNLFNQIRHELISVIDLICTNLPCPDCANHASAYLKSINVGSIRTKHDLKLMLFQFHNVVNKKKGYALFPINDLDSKYDAANTKNIIQNFMLHFQDKHSSIRMIANDMHRARIVKTLKQWFNDNIQYFNE